MRWSETPPTEWTFMARLARRGWYGMLAGAGLLAVSLGDQPAATWRTALGGVGASVLAGSFWAAFVASLKAIRLARDAPRP